jgi:isopentenyldiphosphate isomerase/intracellular septation protein A
LKQLDLFKKLLPGFIPLFIFIIADEIWGMKVGLVVALTIGVGEMVIPWIREKKLDRFVLLDTALLVALSGLSILLENDLFFKLKPAFLELILAAILGLSAFSPVNIIGMMTLKYMKGIEMTASQEILFRRSLRNLLYIILAHIALVIYSAFYLSSEAWAFVSGGLLYILFAIYFIIESVRNRRKVKNRIIQSFEDEEWLPVVQEDGMVIGKAPRSACHTGNKILHPVIHLHVLNSKGYFYLQKRPVYKLVQPDKWDTSVGGHISFGEDLQTALNREAFEEIGLKDFTTRFVGKYLWETEIEYELVYYFVSYDYQKIRLHSKEVSEGKFWSPAQIEREMGTGIFTPNFEFEYNLLKNSGPKFVH